jgi:Bacterial regulatory proteins, luxR family
VPAPVTAIVSRPERLSRARLVVDESAAGCGGGVQHAGAGAGPSNREIAQALFVTEKTVEAHLSSAYRKLGIRARGELAAQLGV